MEKIRGILQLCAKTFEKLRWNNCFSSYVSKSVQIENWSSFRTRTGEETESVANICPQRNTGPKQFNGWIPRTDNSLFFFQTLPDNKTVALFNSFKNAGIIKPGQCRNVNLQEKKGNLQASLNHEYWYKMPNYSILNLCLKKKKERN